MTPLFEVQAFLPHAVSVDSIPGYTITAVPADEFIKAEYYGYTVYLHCDRFHGWRCMVRRDEHTVVQSLRFGDAWKSFDGARGMLADEWRVLRTMSEQLGTVPRPRRAKE